jgi:hypothetical protein
MLRALKDWIRGKPGSGVAKRTSSRKRPASLGVESLETREILSGTPWTPSALVSAYDTGVKAMQGPLTTLVSQELGQKLPVLQQSLDAALGLSSDFQAPFSTLLGMPAGTTSCGALTAVASQLQAAGFTIQYLNTTPEAGSNDLLRVSYTHTWQPSASFSLGGATGFSYLDSGQGQLSGSLQATVKPIVVQLTFGVDVSGGTPPFYVSDASKLTVPGVTVTGGASGQLAIGDLAAVQTSGTVNASLQAGLSLAQLHADHKLRLADLQTSGLAQGGVSGSVALSKVTFTTHLPLLSTGVSWSGGWVANITSNQISTTQVSLTTPDYLTVLRSVAADLFGFSGSFPLLGQMGSELGQPLPIIHESVFQLLGIPTALTAGTSVAGVGSFDSLQSILGRYGVRLDVTPGNAAQVMSDLIHGQQVALLHFNFSDQGTFIDRTLDVPLGEASLYGIVDVRVPQSGRRPRLPAEALDQRGLVRREDWYFHGHLTVQGCVEGAVDPTETTFSQHLSQLKSAQVPE